MTRTALLLTIGLSGIAAGCQGYDRPRENRVKPRPDNPALSFEQQEARGRDKYAIPDDDRRVGPRGYIDRPSPTGR